MASSYVVVVTRQALVRSRPYETAGGIARVVEGRVSRWGVSLAVAAVLFSTVLPLLFLALTAGGSYGEAMRTAGDQILMSVRVSLTGMLMLLLGGTIFAASYRFMKPRGRAMTEFLVLVPLIIPGSAVGLGILMLVIEALGTYSYQVNL